MPLNNRQIKYLRGLSHPMHAVVIVGEKGVSENILAEIDQALDHHELIKIKLRADRETRREWAEQIAKHCGAEKVHAIGQVVCLYRKNPDKPVISLPG